MSSGAGAMQPSCWPWSCSSGVGIATARASLIKWKQYQTRRPTESEILGWIAQYPDRNGCLLTNSVLGRFVLACDRKSALAWARRKGIPFTQTMQTRNGLHFHFVYPDLRVPTIAGEIHEHVDLRGAGGIAMAAGSYHWTGYQYRWQPGHSPQEAPLAVAPEWLLDWLRERGTRRQQAAANIIIEAQPFNGQVSPYAAAIIDRELSALRETLQGARNDKLRDVAFNFGRLAAGGMADGDELLIEVCAVASHWPNQKKSLDTIERAFKAGMEHPRAAPPSLADQLFALREV